MNLTVYKASNGNIFYRHEFFCKDLTDAEIKELHKAAKESYENGDYVEVEAIERDKPIHHISYFLNGKFLASDIHISTTFDPLTDNIYLKKVTGKTQNEALCEATLDYERERIKTGNKNMDIYPSDFD